MKNLYFLLFLLSLTASITAQTTGNIKGKIVDLEFNSEPMLHANIQIKNTPHTVQTNFNGNFEIDNIAIGPYILEVSFAGYDTIEIPIEIIANNTVSLEQGLMIKSIDLNAILSQSNSNDRASKTITEQSLRE